MGILNLVFPKKCLGCEADGGYICMKCKGRVGAARVRCPMCLKYNFGGKTHKSCARKWGMDGVVSVYKYESVMQKAIRKLKYNYVSELAEELGKVVVNELKRNSKLGAPLSVAKDPLSGSVVLVPVPLNKSRERWRGFNQAGEIGKVVAREMCWKYAEIIDRRRDTGSQTGFDRKKRKKNVRGAFCVNPHHDSTLFTALRAGPSKDDPITKDASFMISDYTFIIFDDVWTTGATMRECTKVLKRNGAGEVWGLSVVG